MNKKSIFTLSLLFPLLLGCKGKESSSSESNYVVDSTTEVVLEKDKSIDYVIDESVSNENGSMSYEIFVRSYYDSDNDGIGDLNGVTLKLPYLKSM